MLDLYYNRTMTADEFHKKYGTGGQAQAPQAQPIQQPQQSQGPTGLGGLVRGASNVLSGMGLGAIPQSLGEIIGMFTGRKIQPDNPFMAPEQMQQIQKNPLQNTLGNILGMGSWAIPGGEVSQAANPLVRGALNTAGRLGAGAAMGGLQQAGTNLQQGKPALQDVGQTAGLSGGINAVLPGVGQLAKGAVESHLGNSQSILKNIMDKFLISGGKGGADYTDNPAVIDIVSKNLSDPKKAANALTTAATDLYKNKLEPVYQKIAVPLGEFMKTITADGRYMFSDKEAKIVNNALIKAANSSEGTAKDAISLMIDTGQKTGLANAVRGAQGKIPISLDAVAKFKQALPYNEETAALYDTTKQFIENSVKDMPIAELNNTYHALQDAGAKLEAKYLKGEGKIQLKSNMGWAGRIKAGGIGAALQAATEFATTGSLPTSLSMYSGVGPVLSMVTKMIADERQQFPHTAVPYMQGLQKLEQGGNALYKLLQQIAPRLPGAMNSQPSQP